MLGLRRDSIHSRQQTEPQHAGARLIGGRVVIAVLVVLLPATAAAQFYDAPRHPEFGRLFQRCEAFGEADACRRALAWGRMDPQTRDTLLHSLRNAERNAHYRALNAQLDQLIASCRGGTLADCDRALQMGLSQYGRDRVERARREGLAAAERAEQERRRQEAQAEAARQQSEREEHRRAEEQRRADLARGIGLTRTRSTNLYMHRDFDRLCRGGDYTVTVTWVAPNSSCRECYRSELACANGSKHAMASGISPFSTMLDGVLWRHNGVIGWLTALCIAAVAGIAWAPDQSRTDYLKKAGGFILYVFLVFPQFAYATSLPGRGWYDIGTSLFGLTVVVVLPLFLWIYARPFVIGFDYLFIPHPAENAVEAAVRLGKPVDGAKLSEALLPDINELVAPPPAYRSRNQAARARALRDKLEADQALAEEAVRREQARARQQGWKA